MKCRGCGNESAYHVRTWIEGDEPTDICDQCGDLRMPSHSDVYWPGGPHKNPNICDSMGQPILLRSREHKAQVMKKLQIREAGDSVGGKRSIL